MKVLLGLVLVVLSPGPANAAPEDVANAVAHEVMSPYCPGVTLHDCPSSEAQDMRETIVSWAERGMTKEAIIGRLEDEFGPSVRAVPRAEGAGLLAWLLPGVAVVAGALAAILLARRWTRRLPPPVAPAPAADPGATTRLRAELDRIRSES